MIDAHAKDAFASVAAALLKAGEEVSFVADRRYQSADGTGVIFIAARPSTGAVLAKAGQREQVLACLLDDRQRLLGDQLELGASFGTGPLRHDLLAGYDTEVWLLTRRA